MLWIDLLSCILLIWLKHGFFYIYIDFNYPAVCLSNGRPSYFSSSHPEEIQELFLVINSLLTRKMKLRVPLFLQIGQVVSVVLQAYHPRKMLGLMG